MLAHRPTLSAQSAFEKSLWNKTTRTNARQEGALLDARALHLHAPHPEASACSSNNNKCESMVQEPLVSLLLTAEIIMVDNYVMVYKYLGDLMFYVTGSQDENELILYSVLQAFYESVSLLLRCVLGLSCYRAHSTRNLKLLLHQAHTFFCSTLRSHTE